MNTRLSNPAQHRQAPRYQSRLAYPEVGWPEILFVAGLLLRVFIPADFLELFWHYATPGGSFFGKIHPGAYALFGSFAVLFFTRSRPADPETNAIENASKYFAAAIVAIILLAFMTHHAEGVSYLIDSVLLGPVVVMTLLRFGIRFQSRVLFILIYFMIVNDLLTIFEFSTHYRLFPYSFADFEALSFFRPAALLGHPLLNGMFNAISIPLIWLLPIPATRRSALVLFFLVADFASGARISSLFGLVCAIVSTWIYLRQSVREKRIDSGAMAVFSIATVAVLSVAVILIVATGAADRLIESGLNDPSAQSRFTIFRMLSYLTPRELMFGVARDWADYIVKVQLGMTGIENPFLAYIIQFGGIGTAVLVLALAYFFWRIGRAGGGPLAALSISAAAVIACTSISIATKGPILAFVCAIGLGARATYKLQAQARARPVQRRGQARFRPKGISRPNDVVGEAP